MPLRCGIGGWLEGLIRYRNSRRRIPDLRRMNLLTSTENWPESSEWSKARVGRIVVLGQRNYFDYHISSGLERLGECRIASSAWVQSIPTVVLVAVQPCPFTRVATRTKRAQIAHFCFAVLCNWHDMVNDKFGIFSGYSAKHAGEPIPAHYLVT